MSVSILNAKNIRLQIRQDSAIQDDSVLLHGEFGFKNGKLKIGYNGKKWSELKTIGEELFTIGEGVNSVQAIYDIVNGPVGSSGTTSTNYYAKATGRNAVALTARAFAHGDCSVAAGWNAWAHTKADMSFGMSTNAGLTEDEFKSNNWYPNGYEYSNQITNKDWLWKDPSTGEPVNDHTLNYKGFCNLVVNAAFAVNNSKAQGMYSFASNRAQAIGLYSFACNSGIARGSYSHAEGTGTSADANGAHAEGTNTVASGEGSHSEGGQNTRATGQFSHAQNRDCAANGDWSHAGGYVSYAYANGSFAHGLGIKAGVEGDSTKGTYQAVFGKYNAENENALLIIGNGSSSLRQNAFEVLNNGNVNVSGDLTIGGNFTIKGNIETQNVTTLTVKDKYIAINAGASSGLAGIAGVIIDAGEEDAQGKRKAYAAPIYDKSTNSLKLGLGTYTEEDGDIIDFNFNEGEAQCLATRDDEIENNRILKWDEINKKIVASTEPESNIQNREQKGHLHIGDIDYELKLGSEPESGKIVFVLEGS